MQLLKSSHEKHCQVRLESDDGGSWGLSDGALEALGRITSRNDISISQAIEQSALNEDFLLGREYEGNRLLLLQPSGKLRCIERVETQA